MTTPTDTAKLADEIERLSAARKTNNVEDMRKAEMDYRIFLMNKMPTIIAALRELEALKAENAKLRDYEALAKAAARWSHPERRQPHCAVTAEEMLSAIWHHPSRAALGGAG